MTETPTIAVLKKEIRALRKSIAEALQAKNSAEAKKLRRKVKRLKARTRSLARRKSKPSEAPAAA
jgi:uncharacterized membrane protein (DUF106 family)